MKAILLCFLCFFIGYANQSSKEYKIKAGSADAFCVSSDTLGISVLMKKPSIHWAYLIDENEGIVKVYFNKHVNEMCREKTNDIVISRNSIFRGKAYISIISHENNLTYKGEAEFYLEDRYGKLQKVPNSVDKESIALFFRKGKEAEIEVAFPQNCQPGDYCLRIRVYNEEEECYEIYQWYEAYTSKRASNRQKPILVGPALTPDYQTPAIEDGVFEVVERMPEFPGGGMPQLMEFIKNNLQYEKAKDGNNTRKRVIVQIIIDRDGTVTYPKIIRGASPKLDKEALRVIELMPKWKPGSQHGIPVKVRFTFPVNFDSPVD